MAFHSTVSIEQVTFKDDDIRYHDEVIKSFDSLVNFNNDIPIKEMINYETNVTEEQNGVQNCMFKIIRFL